MTRPILVIKTFFLVMLALYPITGIVSGIMRGTRLLVLGGVFGLGGAFGIAVVVYMDYRTMNVQRARIRGQLGTIDGQAAKIERQRQQIDAGRDAWGQP